MALARKAAASSILAQSGTAITIWVDPVVADQLKEIAFHDKKPQQELFLEALNILFSKCSRPEIA
jgi:hypothetical protein